MVEVTWYHVYKLFPIDKKGWIFQVSEKPFRIGRVNLQSSQIRISKSAMFIDEIISWNLIKIEFYRGF